MILLGTLQTAQGKRAALFGLRWAGAALMSADSSAADVELCDDSAEFYQQSGTSCGPARPDARLPIKIKRIPGGYALLP